MKQVFLGFGSNMGNSQKTVTEAIKMISENKNFKMINKSSLYKTEPLLYKNQDYFINAVAEFSTNFNAKSTLKYIHKIENKYHRKRNKKKRYGPRTLDIDILFYNNETINTDFLKIPHPKFSERKFVLIPMTEIASNYEVINTNKTINSYLNECSDSSKVEKLK
ncbi:MAG: 2-amino-4-hydroxy-6-hydroxymethyldihydropteridine diphosphokinase [Candidatus Marinimicrobia bacterium]|nr:2-amino-4-hydroxy-6-hydroxymethyldihydropteridine diphosphokinase [Candidatus Neomarinimicrobiota bacterium]